MQIYIHHGRPVLKLIIDDSSLFSILVALIKEIVVINNSVVKIDLGDPLRNVYIRAQDVISPNSGANNIASILNARIRECLCEQIAA